MRDQLQSDKCSSYLKALADPDRLRIVQCLSDGDKSVGEISKALDIPLANASHHLILLKNAGLVIAEKRGRFVHYQLAPKFRKTSGSTSLDVLEFGCCRIELGKKTSADGGA